MDRPRLVGADLVRCAACANLVAIVRDGVVTVKHKGRTVVVTPPEAVRRITCEACGTDTTPVEAATPVGTERPRVE